MLFLNFIVICGKIKPERGRLFMNIDDIYLRVGMILLEMDYWSLSIEEKKKAVDAALKKYISEKISASGYNSITDENDLKLMDYIEVLLSVTPKAYHRKILERLTFYIIGVVNQLQGWEVLWYVKDDEKYIDQPCTEFSNDDLWQSLTTNPNTDAKKVFSFVYDVFINYFMKDYKKKTLTSNITEKAKEQ